VLRSRSGVLDPTIVVMQKKRRTNEEAVEQSGHVLYEVQMLGALRGHFLNGDHDRAVARLPLDGLASRNALVEAFQIHARQLIDFLTDRPSRKEATAAEFTVGEWSIADDDRKALKKLSGEFSQRVAHLTWRRSQLDAAQQRVMTEDIFDAIRRHLLAFLEHIDPDRVQAEFLPEVAEAMFMRVADPGHPQHLIPTVDPAVLRATTYPGGTATGALRPSSPSSDGT
jgi:hypothetical protein